MFQCAQASIHAGSNGRQTLFMFPGHARGRRCVLPGGGTRVIGTRTRAHSNDERLPATLDDIKRQRLRFGDRPSRRWRQQLKQKDPDLTEQLQQLQSPSDAAALIFVWWKQLLRRADAFLGRKLYEYFNWRQDTSKDLLVTFGVFSALVLVAGAVRRWAVDEPAERAAGNLWADVYQVCQWVFGQEFPGPDAPLGQQVLSVGTAMIGLAAFAMVLALVEQVVLETLEANVKRGSKVFESGHIFVLGWCVSQRDLEVVRKVVQQVCVAHAPEAGTTVVVMTERSKLEMEGIFWRCLPESKRYGTKLVFRQGSPLVPSDLRLVGASRAAATIVVSDQSRSAAEADAQAVRCAILLDELDDDEHDTLLQQSYLTALAAAAKKGEDELLAPQLDLSLLGRHVVVELKTANALPLLKYACSSRVMALPTSQLNAQRLAKMVKRPVISIISQQLFNFENGVSVYVHYYLHLVGTRFGDLAYLFPDGIVMGLVDRASGKAKMTPSRDCYVQPNHALVVIRPTNISSHSYKPLALPPSRELLRLQDALAAWNGPKDRALHAHDWQLSEALVSAHEGTAGTPAQHPSLATVAATGGSEALPAANASSSSSSSNSSGAGRGREVVQEVPMWSSTVSQVELLRLQVEASSRYADGQPSVASIEPVGVAAAQQQGQAMVFNNIVPLPQLGAGLRVSQLQEPSDATSLVMPGFAVAAVPREVLASSNVASSTAGGAVCLSGVAPPASADTTVGQAAGTSSLAAQAGTVAQQYSNYSAVTNRLPTADLLATPFSAVTNSSSGATPASRPAAGSSTSGSSCGARSTHTTGAALRTADWPVLSGAHQHCATKGLWGLRRQSRQQHTGLATAVEECISSHTWKSGFAPDSSVETGTSSRVLPVSSRSQRMSGAVNDAAVLVPPEYFSVDECAEKVCVLGWGPNSLMVDLIKELDHGLSALPKGSEVVFVNMHNPHDSLGQALQHATLENIQVRHVAANPLQRSSLGAALDVSTFRCALVLCDELWVDPDNKDANGLDSLDEPSVLRLDSLVMVAQLNMRKLLEDSKLPAINIICQKVATEGLTRFEDRHRLPLGISVNLNSFAAKMLAQIAANPLMLVPVTRLGEDATLTIMDSSCFAELGEELNFWQLMARCQVVGDVLLGYYEIPEHLDEPLNTVVNPIGLKVRCTPRVWNRGDGRLKFILLCHKSFNHGSTSGSHDDMELENTKQAGWVAGRQRTPHASAQGSPSHSHPNSWTDAQ